MENLSLVQVVQRHGYLSGYLHDSQVVEAVLFLVKQFKKTASRDKFSDHGVHAVSVETDSHVENYVRMSQLIKHLDLFNEVLHGFP